MSDHLLGSGPRHPTENHDLIRIDRIHSAALTRLGIELGNQTGADAHSDRGVLIAMVKQKDVELAELRETLLSCYEDRAAPQCLSTADLGRLIKQDLNLVRRTAKVRGERLAVCQREHIAAKEIITRAEDLRRRAEELDEEFNHDEGSTVENALGYVLGKEPAESCIILQMHIDAAGN